MKMMAGQIAYLHIFDGQCYFLNFLFYIVVFSFYHQIPALPLTRNLITQHNYEKGLKYSTNKSVSLKLIVALFSVVRKLSLIHLQFCVTFNAR